MKRKGIKNLGISLSALNEENAKEKEETKEVSIADMNEPFSPLELINAWKACIKQDRIQEEPHLFNTMLVCLPDLKENRVFEVVVNNPMQEEKLNEFAMDILTYLRTELKNSRIRMVTRISEDNEKKLAFTAHEKFKLMSEENPSLQRLKDEFGLELN